MIENLISWLPAVCAVYLPLSFIISYAMAVGLKHVEADFPYISDTGTFTPESGVFGELLNIYAVMTALVVYVKYHQMSMYYGTAVTKLQYWGNILLLILGLLSALGASLVANFQETRIDAGHKTGAAMVFGCSAIYIYILTYLSFKMQDLPGCTPFIRLVRVVLIVLHFASLLTTIVETEISSHKLNGNWTFGEIQKAGRWSSYVGGHTDHIVATVGEWLTALLLSTYFLTFHGEFRKLTITFLKVEFTQSYSVNESKNEQNIVNLNFHI